MSSIWMKPVSSPKAWRGETLARDTSWLVTLTAAEIADVDRALATAKATGRSMEDIGREHFPLTALRPRLEQTVAELYDGRGFVVLRGLPVQRYSDDDVGLIFWGLGRYLGGPLYQNPQGELLGHVYDHGRTYGNIDVRGYETNAYLPYHTDAGDMVGLLCLRRALAGGLSSIVSSVAVHNEINAGAVKRGVPLTMLEQAALDHLDEQTRRPDLRLDMDLQAGDIQFINNYTILHSRTGFVDSPEPDQKRHMLRLWLKFAKPWPLSAEFPTHLGYKPSQDTPELVEAER